MNTTQVKVEADQPDVKASPSIVTYIVSDQAQMNVSQPIYVIKGITWVHYVRLAIADCFQGTAYVERTVYLCHHVHYTFLVIYSPLLIARIVKCAI